MKMLNKIKFEKEITNMYTIKRNVDEETIMTICDEEVRVDFVNIGEGWYGDYNPDNPEDEELIRFDVYIKDDTEEKDVWHEVDDASYCTSIPVNTPLDELEKKIKIIFNEYKNVYSHIISGGSVKKLGEALSWI